MVQISNTDKQLSNLFGIGLLFAFILPHTSTGLLLINPLFCILYQCFRQNRIWYNKSIFLIIILFIPLLFNLNQELGQKSISSFITILLYIVCFPIVWRVKVSNVWLYIILSLIFLSQIIYVLKIPYLIDFLDTYYPIQDTYANQISVIKRNIRFSTITDYRLGGLYRNPNQCSRALTMLMSFYIINNYEKPVRSTMFFVILSIVAILFTGSRTGLLVGGIIIAIDIFYIKKVPSGIRAIYIIFLIGAFIYFILIGSGMYRGLDMSSGFNNSMSLKYEVFLDYLHQERSVLRLMVGNFDPKKYVASSSDLLGIFDTDYGNLIFQFGFLGFIAILYYLFTIFKKMDRVGRSFFVLLLWMFSSTIVCSYRAFFIFMLELSVIYSDSRMRK